jgi:hypothetical protein
MKRLVAFPVARKPALAIADQVALTVAAINVPLCSVDRSVSASALGQMPGNSRRMTVDANFAFPFGLS